MVEREMQELLWRCPERFLNEHLKQVAWEASSDVGRADLVFEDRHGRLLVIEVKRGKLPRGAIDQLLDYFGMMKQRFPNRPVELMAVANSIPSERRLACESRDIECREISEKTFRDVAAEVGYTFVSESAPSPSVHLPNAVAPEPHGTTALGIRGKVKESKDTALYIVVRHPRKPSEQGKKQWQNKWQDDCRIESITTIHSLAELCEAEKKKDNLVYIHRCGFVSERIPPTITCSARVGDVKYREGQAVVPFLVERMLGDREKGVPATKEQRMAARRRKFYRASAP